MSYAVIILYYLTFERKIEGADVEEKLIYHIVEEAGNKGNG